jgi:hypothetical protein
LTPGGTTTGCEFAAIGAGAASEWTGSVIDEACGGNAESGGPGACEPARQSQRAMVRFSASIRSSIAWVPGLGTVLPALASP